MPPTARLHWYVVAVLLSCSAARAQTTGGVEGAVSLGTIPPAPAAALYAVHTKKPIAAADPPRAIVYLERDDGIYPPSTVPVASIGQQGYQFRPGVSAVRTGTQVAFPNGDDEFHNVFSYSRAKRFDLGRFRKDEVSPLITFDQPGLVKIYCEIHKHMRSLLLVLDTPWFTPTDEKGNFKLTNVPPGDYRIRAFLPSEETRDSRVAIVAGETARVALGP